MDSGFHHHELTFGKRFQLVGCEQRSFDHLQGFGGIVSAAGHRSRHDGKFLSRFEKFEEKCCIYEEEYGVKVIRINDGDGVFIDKDITICKK